MSEIETILQHKQHRPFDLPNTKWSYYQEWNKALFLHWKIPLSILEGLVPEGLEIDTFEGNAYVSLVAFTMEKIRPRNLPAVHFISDFDEINVRTYVVNNSKQGVYFLNIEAAKSLSVFIARKLSGLPYEKANIKRTESTYHSVNKRKGFYLKAVFEKRELLQSKTALDHWLTERYCLYVENGKSLYRYDIHHKEWEINNVEINQLELNYSFHQFSLTTNPDKTHFSEGVKVIAWNKVLL